MILLSGDSGFVGGYLATTLLGRNISVRGIDTRPLGATTSPYAHITGNILEPTVLRDAGQGVETIIHLAAEHKDFGISTAQYFRVNVGGTEQLLNMASERRIRRFIFFSSVAVYGDQEAPAEDTTPHPTNPYGESKLQAEKAVIAWAAADPARCAVIIRPTVVFGPWSKANIFKLIRFVCDGRFIWVGNGENIKSIAYIRNLVAATEFLMERQTSGVEIYNYADEPHLRTCDLVELIAQAAGISAPRLHLPLGPALAAARLFDLVAGLTGRDLPVTTARLRKFNATTMIHSDKIRSAGFVPPFTIEQGIRENVRWYLDEYKPRILRAEESYDH